ncbi:MAG: TonB family protein [Firmicutes bacterium]|nr:TonB family protein [Bacillota bacterium]
MKRALLLSFVIHLALLPVIGYYLQQLSVNQLEQPVIEIELTSESSAALPDSATTTPPSLYSPSLSTSETTPAASGAAAINTFYQQTVPDNSISSSNSPLAFSSQIAAVSVQTGAPSDTVVSASPNSIDKSGRQPAPHTITPPKILRKLEPEYPEQARKKQIQGAVTLKVEILASGKATNISILASSGSALLDQTAIDSVRQWSFVPAKDSVTGEPVSCITHIPFLFRTD